VNRRYLAGVEDSLRVLGEPVASKWLPHLSDPRILIDESLRDALLAQFAKAGLNGAGLVDAARHVMVQSIHIGVVLTGSAALIAAFVVRRIAHITFRRS